MAKRYPHCQFSEKSMCSMCSLSNYGRDCRNNPVNPIAYRRELTGLSQRELGEIIGFKKSPQSRISEWEIGKVIPGSTNLLKLAKALNCQIADLME